MDKLTAGGVDVTKLPVDQIIPQIQKFAADLLQTNPNLLAGIKSTLESLTNTKLPDLAPNNSPTSTDGSNATTFFK